jgi:predicted glycoside hydrolase/deacetylase ChbG (UPF0249 family)/glycosyltransferase involved in cell wall biosynthesis
VAPRRARGEVLVTPAQSLSACLIVQDEEARLPACLAAVAFCDEIVVVDGGSRDATAAIARAAGARVVENPWPGYAAQRNLALDLASSTWVLEIDADERVTPSLAAEIQAFLADPPTGVDVVALPLRHRFLGRPLGPAGHYPLYRNRLLRRAEVRHDETRLVHERIAAQGRVHAMRGEIEHLLADSPGEALADAWRYSKLQAGELAAPADARSYVVGLIARPAAKALWRLVVSGAWRDGWRGVLLVTIDAAADAAVWARLLTRRVAGHQITGRRLTGHQITGRRLAGREVTGADARHGHFVREVHSGAPHIVVLAGVRSAARATAWAEQARALGAAVSVLSTRPAGPLRAIRELERAARLQPIDLVVGFGPAATLLLRLLPTRSTGARPAAAGAALRPAAAVRRALAHPDRTPPAGLLIVNADDLGLDAASTDAILECFLAGLITSATAMVHMADSRRAADRARALGLPVGLHINLSEPFTARDVPEAVRHAQAAITRRFTARQRRWRRWIPDPTIAPLVERCVRDQLASFEALYGRAPTHVDGHMHVHISPTVARTPALSWAPMRRALSDPPETCALTALARSARHHLVLARTPGTDRFLSIKSLGDDLRAGRAPRALPPAAGEAVEVMVHPGVPAERALLTEDAWTRVLSASRLGTYSDLA